MAFNSEIKNFAKNTIILTVIFAFAIHFSWEYIVSSLGFSAQAHNDMNFENANISYIGNTATALSLKLGGASRSQSINNISWNDAISIEEVLHNPSVGQEKLIASNMLAITTYANILQADIVNLLNTSTNRSVALDNHISLLKSYHTKTRENISIVRDQKNDLQNILQQTSWIQNEAKGVLQNSYKTLEYSGVDNAISEFLKAKNLNNQAKIYMIYLERFEKSYNVLQNKNLKIIDILTQNRDALIKNATVVIPQSGTDIVKELWLIQSESDYKAQKALE